MNFNLCLQKLVLCPVLDVSDGVSCLDQNPHRGQQAISLYIGTVRENPPAWIKCSEGVCKIKINYYP